MNHPTTLRGWLQAGAALAAILGFLGSAGYGFYRINAWTGDVERVEQLASEGLKAVNCALINNQIRALEEKEARGDITPREKAWLNDLLRKWEKNCVS